jgi:hypothetical protein
MMDGLALQDLIAKGMGRAARKLGQPTVVYRPTSVAAPCDTRNKIITLSAWFEAAGRGQVPGFTSALWSGVFDASYTSPGDYLVGAQGTFYVAAQMPALPVQCVLTNRVVSLLRNTVALPGSYGGLYGGAVETLLTGFPASVLPEASRGAGGTGRETHFGSWVLLLPTLPGAAGGMVPQVGDVAQDDLSQTYVVGAAEHCALGWRLTVRQVGA